MGQFHGYVKLPEGNGDYLMVYKPTNNYDTMGYWKLWDR